MKKRFWYVFFLVAMQLNAAEFFKKIGQSFQEGVVEPVKQKIIKPIEQKVINPAKQEISRAVQTLQDPAKLAVDLSKQALASMGVNIDGIVANIDTIKTTLARMQQDIQAINNAMNSADSPIKKGPVIINAINNFQTKADAVMKQVSLSEVTTALSSLSALGNIVQKLTTNTLQTDLRKLYDSYNAVIQEIDAVNIRPLLQSGQATLIDMANMLDKCLSIRNYAGSLSQTVISNDIATAIQNMSASLRAIAGDLDKIIQGGVRKIQSAQAELAQNLIANLGNINKLVASIRETITNIPPHINQITTYINAMNTAKDQLITTATDIPKRLEQQVLEKVKTVTGVFAVPTVAIDTLRKMIMDIRNETHAIVRSARNAVAEVAEIIRKGISGVDAFKTYIKFDVVPPQSRIGLTALPDDVQRLSSSIEQLRRALP